MVEYIYIVTKYADDSKEEGVQLQTLDNIAKGGTEYFNLLWVDKFAILFCKKQIKEHESMWF